MKNKTKINSIAVGMFFAMIPIYAISFITLALSFPSQLIAIYGGLIIPFLIWVYIFYKKKKTKEKLSNFQLGLGKGAKIYFIIMFVLLIVTK